jgi:NAD:arginine ADP-ribosyltransferase
MHGEETDLINVVGVSAQEKLAIRLYTIEQPVKIYAVVNAPFKQSSRSPDASKHQAPFCKILIRAIRALAALPDCCYQGTAYRGIRIAGDEPHHRDLQSKYANHHEAYPVGGRLTFAPFTSLTLSETVAEGFGDAIFFVFQNVRAVRIGALSAIGTEEEVLMEPPSVFRIIACAKFNGCLQVTLDWVESRGRYLS